MIIRKSLAVALLGAIPFADASAEETYDDAAVSREFLRLRGYFCGTEDPVGSSLRWILSTCCGNDTNRYVRVAKETATTNEIFASTAINIVLRHGTSNDVAFLRQYTNDVDNVYLAGIGVLKLGGVTTNTLNIVSDCLSTVDNTKSEQDLLATYVLERVFRENCSLSIRNQAQSIVTEFGRRTTGVRRIDTLLRECDPTYTYSKRRLSVLRSASVLNLIDMQRDYTTNAINELVAYPESALPD